jgi:hypothetical protein
MSTKKGIDSLTILAILLSCRSEIILFYFILNILLFFIERP